MHFTQCLVFIKFHKSSVHVVHNLFKDIIFPQIMRLGIYNVNHNTMLTFLTQDVHFTTCPNFMQKIQFSFVSMHFILREYISHLKECITQ